MMRDSRRIQRTITALATVIILLISLSSTSPLTQASYPPVQAAYERVGDVKFRGVVVDPSQNPMSCPFIYNVLFYCIHVQNVLSGPNNVLSGWSGPLMVIIGGMGFVYPNTEDVETGDVAEVYASCSMNPARDPSVTCILSKNYHYVRRISQQAVTITVTSTITSTVTTYTTITSNTVTSVTTFTTTRYTTGTRTTDVTRTYTFTRTVTTTVTMTTTTTTTITGPDVRIESIATERASYRPGELITLYINLRNYGSEASRGEVCYKIKAEYHSDWPWTCRCVNVGPIGPGERKTITDAGYDGALYGWYGNDGRLDIEARLEEVDGKPVSQPPAGTTVSIYIDGTITVGSQEPYVIKDLRKNEVRSYIVTHEGTPCMGGYPYVGVLELTIRRLDWGLLDIDSTVDVRLATGITPRGAYCEPGGALEVQVGKLFKKFNITVVHHRPGGTVYSSEEETPKHRISYIADTDPCYDYCILCLWCPPWFTISYICETQECSYRPSPYPASYIPSNQTPHIHILGQTSPMQTCTMRSLLEGYP